MNRNFKIIGLIGGGVFLRSSIGMNLITPESMLMVLFTILFLSFGTFEIAIINIISDFDSNKKKCF